MDIIPEHHISSLLGARTAQGVLEELVAEHLPEVWNHLKEMDVPLAMISMQWFFSLYLTDFAPETALQVSFLLSFSNSFSLLAFYPLLLSNKKPKGP